MVGEGGEGGFWAGRKVLVTGASGFIGSHLVEMLIAERARVTGTSTRQSPEFLSRALPHMRLLTGNLKDPAFCERAVEGQDTVLHLAAHVGGIQYNIAHHATLFRDNMHMFMNVIEAARKAATPIFLTTSSACVYPHDATIPTPEEEGFKDLPERTNEGYGMAKRMEEYLSMQYAREFGMRIAIARLYNAYGPRDDMDPKTSHVIPGLIHRIMSGEDPLVVWGSGNQSRAFVYVEDLARGIMLTAERYAAADPVNIGTSREVTIRELVDMLLSITGKRPRVVWDTGKPEGQQRRNCDTTKMKRVLGWEPEIGIEEGLKRTVAWYVQHSKE